MSGFSTRNMQHYRVRTNNFVAESQDYVFKWSSMYAMRTVVSIMVWPIL